jgi:hypothetical protein
VIKPNSRQFEAPLIFKSRFHSGRSLETPSQVKTEISSAIFLVSNEIKELRILKVDAGGKAVELP